MALIARVWALAFSIAVVLLVNTQTAVAQSAPNCSLFSETDATRAYPGYDPNSPNARSSVFQANFIAGEQLRNVRIEWGDAGERPTDIITSFTITLYDGSSGPQIAAPVTSMTAADGADTGFASFPDITLTGSSSNIYASLTATFAETPPGSGLVPVTRLWSALFFTCGTSTPPASTTTTISSSLNPSQFGNAVTFTATVTPAAATGTVEFREGATVLGSGTLNASGIATLTTSALSVATHPVTAYYLGDSSNAASNSQPLNQVVNAVGTTTDSDRLDDVQDAATGVAAQLASENITDSVAEEIAAAMSGQVQVMSASEGKVGLVYAPGMGKGTMITQTADVASGGSDMAAWRIWSSLRYTDFNSNALDGDQVNAMLGASILFGDGLVAGLVAGYEDQDYEDVANATLKGEGFNIGSYVGGNLGSGLRFDAQVHASFLDYDMASGAVTGSTDATRLIFGGGLAHAFELGAFTIEPTARFSGTWEWQDAYTDSAAVAHADRDFHFGRLSAGTKIMHRFDMGDGASFSPSVTGFADYRFSGGSAPAQESLLDGMSARVGIGLDFRAANGITASALGEFSGLGLDNNATAKSVKAQLAIPF